MPFGFSDINFRKQGNEHSLRGLAGAFTTRINVIIVTTSGHHIVQHNPPDNATAFRGDLVDLPGLRTQSPLPLNYKDPERGT